MTQRIELSFLCISPRIKLLFFQTWLKKLNPFSIEYDAKNWTFLSNTTHRNEPLFFFWIWLTEMNHSFFEFDSEMNHSFFWITTFFEYDSQNWTSFLKMTQRLESFFPQNMTFKNWTFVKNMTQRIDFCVMNQSLFLKIIWLQELKLVWFGRWIFFNLNQRIKPFSNNISQLLTIFWTWLTEIEHLVQKHDSQNCLKNMTHRDWTLLFNMTQRNDSIFSTTQSIFLFYKRYDSKNKLIVLRKYDSNFFKKNDSMNWTFSKIDSKNWTFLFEKKDQRIEPFSFLFDVTQRFELSANSKNGTLLKKYDSL